MNSAVAEDREPRSRQLKTQKSSLLTHFEILINAPGSAARLRELIITLAVQGKLVPQCPNDEPASALLLRIGAAKDMLIAEGKIKREKPSVRIDQEPVDLPSGWVWIDASDVCALVTDGDHQPPPKTDFGVPFLVIGDLRAGCVDLAVASRFVPTEYFEALDWGKRPLAGDVLYTTVGSFGIPIPVTAQEEFCFQRHIALFRPAVADIQGFLSLALQSNYVFRQAEKGATGIAQKTVPLSVLRKFRLPLPPLAEQSRIVARVDELMRLCDALEAKGKLEVAQHALLVDALLGTLTRSKSPEELTENWLRVAAYFDLLLDRPEAVDALEQTILQLAVRGMLVAQNSRDESASVLLEEIRAESDRERTQRPSKRDDQPVRSDQEAP